MNGILPHGAETLPRRSDLITLRPYQIESRERLSALIRSGKKRLLLRAPCGAGKGTICADIVHRAASREKSSLFLVDRRVIVKDFSQRLDRLGVDHGVIMANHPRRRPELRTHVASIDTLYRREVLPRADLIIVDECRSALSPKWTDVLARYPESVIIGLDATPMRPDGRGLGELFQEMVELPNEAELVDMGYLVPVRVFAPSAPDLKGVHMVAGDFNEKELAAVIDNSKIIGNLPEHWHKYAPGRKTLAFGVNKRHAHEIADTFRASGVRTEVVVDDTPEAERERVWDELDNGGLLMVAGVGVFGYGFDHPIVSCVISARPTQSLPLYMQQLGRGARTHRGKTDCVYLDHAGNTARHGFFDDPREWTLEGKRKKKGTAYDPALSVRLCRECWACFKSVLDKCPYCDAAVIREEREIAHEDGELKEVAPPTRCDRCELDSAEVTPGAVCQRCHVGTMRRTYMIKTLSKNPLIAKLQQEAQDKGYNGGWIWARLQAIKRKRPALVSA